MPSDIERADRISLGRAVIAPFIGAAMLGAQQWLFFGRDWDALSPWQLGIWAVLAVLVLALVLTGGSWFVPKSLRAHVDDEASRIHRLQALVGGFLAMMITALLVFVVSPFEPLEAQRAAHIIISMGLGVSLAGFGLAEVRALG